MTDSTPPIDENNAPESAKEGARRATGFADSGAAAAEPDPEVPAKTTRRKYTQVYKQRILEQADACTQPGEIGALLRREGLYSSHLSAWRRQRDEGGVKALAAHKRGRKVDPSLPEKRRIEALERENARLKKRLEQAELIIDAQKKVSTLLGVTLPSHEMK